MHRASHKAEQKSSGVIAMRQRFLATALTMMLCLPTMGRSEEIWLAAVDPYTQAMRHWQASVDYMQLFKPDAPWQTVARRINVFKIGPGFSSSGNQQELSTIVEELRHRGISLALEVGLLRLTPDCPKKDEAHIAPETLEMMLARLKSLGANPKYIAMDEPLHFGHYLKKPGVCGDSVADVAKQLVPNLELVKRYFPEALVGDIEPIGISPQFLSDIDLFTSEYEKAAKTPLAFLHADVFWSQHAMENLVPLSRFLSARSIPFGIIYNAAHEAEADSAWAQSTEKHIAEVESRLGIRPDAAIFQTWVQYPSHVLPETQPATLTNIVLNYLRTPTDLTVQKLDHELVGRLKDESGRPVPHVRLTISATDTGASSVPMEKDIRGVVPHEAVKAVIGLRINTEGVCACATSAYVKLGPAAYRDTWNSSPVIVSLTGENVSKVREFRTIGTTPITVNSHQFLATAGADFHVTIPVAANSASEAAGYVTIIFLDSNGKGIGRKLWFLRPNEWSVGQVIVDASGEFRYKFDSGVPAAAGVAVRVDYGGDSHLRPAAWSTK
jgi:hypothetical protein